MRYESPRSRDRPGADACECIDTRPCWFWHGPFGVLSIPRLSAYLQPQGELVPAAELAGLVFGRSS
jgi:hypothetical protein